MKYKAKIIILLIVVLTSILSDTVYSTTGKIDVTASIGDKAYLDKGTLGFYSIQKKNDEGKWIYVTYSIIKYKDGNGDEHVAYCLDESKFGVGYVKGDVDGYEVQLTKLISDEKVWRVIINGYPYKTPEELGVETEDDAYLATKRAIYAVVKGYTEKDVMENYRVGDKVIKGQALEDIKRRGEKVLTAICNLVNIGNNGTQNIENEVKIIKEGEFEEDEANGCYYQKYKVDSRVALSEYTITEVLNFPEGTKIVDENGDERKTFSSGEEFIVVINKEHFVENIEGTIKISAKCKTYPIYYGTAPEGYQDYAICSGYWDNLYSTVVLKEEKPPEPEEPKTPEPETPPEETEEPEVPENPVEPETPEEPMQELPRTGEDGILKGIIFTIFIISLSIMLILVCLIKKIK